MTEYPFRFYGAEPIEWNEGANDGHRYEVTFQRTLDADAKAALARTWETALERGPARGADSIPWRWLDRSAVYFVGEREHDMPAFFAAMRALLETIHDTFPLEEAVFRGAWWEDGDRPWGRGAWDAWSVRQRPEPIRAFASDRTGEVDPGFERARRVARLGEETVAAGEAIEAERLTRAELALVPPTGPAITYAIPKRANRTLGVAYAHQVLGSASGRVYTKPSNTKDPVAWLADDGSVMKWAEAPVEHGPVVSSDGTRIAIAIVGSPRSAEQAPSVSSPHERAGHQVVIIELADGRSRAVWRTDPEDCYIRGLWVGRSQLVVLTKSLRLFSLDDDGATQLDQCGEGNTTTALCYGLHGDRVLIVIANHGGVDAYRIDRGKLERFGSVPGRPQRFKHWPLPRTDGTRIVGVTDPSQTPIELVNVEARWRATFDDPL